MIGLLAVAFLLRLGMVVMTPRPEDYPDVQDFVYHANAIIDGRYPDRNVEGLYSFRAPLYPFLLSLFFRLFGYRFIFVTVFQAVIGVVLVYGIYALARRWFDERAAVVAGALAAVYPYLLYPVAYVQTESVYTLLAFTATLWFVRAVGADGIELRRWLPYAVGAGALGGLAMLCRPSALLLILILGAWVATMVVFRIGPGGRAVVPLLVFLFAAAVIVLPWTIRNYVRFSELIIVNNQAGEIFWLGNNAHYRELFRTETPEAFRATLAAMWSELQADRPMVGHLSPGAIDRYYWEKGWRYIASSPREWMTLLFLKWLAFWRPWPNPVAHGAGSALISALVATPVFVGAAVGMVQLFRRRRYESFGLLLMLIVVHAVFFTLFHPAVRYRTPSVDVFLLVLAGGGLGDLVTRWSRST